MLTLGILTACCAVILFLAFCQAAKLHQELVTINTQLYALELQRGQLQDDILRFPGYESSHSARELGQILNQESLLTERRGEILWMLTLLSTQEVNPDSRNLALSA